jgi:S1-C subfamily serine protease
MNYVDLLIALILFIVIFRGAEAGMVRQVLSLVGLVLGIGIGSLLASLFHADALVSLLLISVTTIITMAYSEYFGLLIKNRVRNVRLHKVDGILGAGIGCIIGLLFIWFSASLVSAVPSTNFREAVRDSKVIGWLDDTLPPATQIVDWLNATLAQTKLPDIVKQLEPRLPNLTATLPNIGEFSDVIAATKSSVVEVEGRSCNGLSVGSGFVAQNNIIVTNAHVVAGMLHPYVYDQNGRHSSKVIGFDPDLDIAVLRVSDLAGSPLTIASTTVPSGTKAVALGYPGGGPFTAQAGVVVERFTAIGSNIYNEGSNKREVYALKADIEPGNSGGPLINKANQVIGVIFAKSTAYSKVGYALSSPEVATNVQQVLAHPGSPDSTRCAAE